MTTPEEIQKTKALAHQQIDNAETFISIAVNNGMMDITTVGDKNKLAMMLLALARTRPDYMEAVNFAALAIARERLVSENRQK